MRVRPSSSPEPRPPLCLNCGAAVPASDRFCGTCGQENEASPVSFAALVREAWDEFIKIDAKLLLTLRYLVFRPGFLSAEYVRGRRTAYLSPFKMYLAVSALFFLVWGLIVPFDRLNTVQEEAAQIEAKLVAEQKKLEREAKKHGVKPAPLSPKSSTKEDIVINSPLDVYQVFKKKGASFFHVTIPFAGLPATVSAYRDRQAEMPQTKRDAPVLHYLKERVIRFNSDPAEAAKNLFSTGLPFLLLIQLPLFAAWMRVLYFRQKRLYVEHLVFLLHTHTFFFLLTGILFIVDAAAQSVGTRVPLLERGETWGLLTLVVTIYNILAYRHFYAQGWGKTLLKGWFLLNGYVFLLAFTVGIAAAVAIVWTLLVPV